jgi:hypothetical protein
LKIVILNIAERNLPVKPIRPPPSPLLRKHQGKLPEPPRRAYFTAPITASNTSSVTEELDITAVKFDAALDKDVVSTVTSKYTV